MSTWTASPSGSDIAVTPGLYVAVVASVGSGTSKSDLLSHVPAGVDVVAYHEQGDGSGLPVDPDSGRKTVAIAAHSTLYTGTLAWSKSILWDRLYTLSAAWTAPAGANPGAPPFSSAAVARAGVSAWNWTWVLGTAAVAGVGYGLHRWWIRRREQHRR